jgi:hypothetical protein
MGALKKYDGFYDVDVVVKLISFGADGGMLSRGCVMVLFAKCKINIPPIWKTCITWHIAPI